MSIVRARSLSELVKFTALAALARTSSFGKGCLWLVIRKPLS